MNCVSIAVRCHEADLTELIYVASQQSYMVVAGRRVKPLPTSPRGEITSPRSGEQEDGIMIISIVVPIVTSIIRRSQLEKWESSLKSEGRMIWKIEDAEKKKIRVYEVAAIFFKVDGDAFQFERPKHLKQIENDLKSL